MRRISRLLTKASCRLLKKIQRRGAQFSWFVFVVRVRPESSTSTSHDFREAVERNEAYESFSTAC